ncbi:MAG: alpha/beta hydrolase [Flavobacteriaceae bacterium]|nr:alpha/beta hydrolase [Flavobacteriaceae bacterium]
MINIKSFSFFFIFSLFLFWTLYTPDLPIDELKEKYSNNYSKFMFIDGINVHYRDEGEGFPILLIHGTGSSLHTWDEWTKKLKNKNRVIRSDLPGYGLTGFDSKKNYSLDYYKLFIEKFIDHLNLEKLYLAGNSLGGSISWYYSSFNQNKVEKLILVSPGGFPQDKGLPFVFKIARTPIINQILKFFTPRRFIEMNLKEVYHDDKKISEPLIDRYYELILREGNREAFINRAFIERQDFTNRLKLINCSTLIIWGKQDNWIPYTDALKFEKKIPDNKLIIMDKTGHVPMEERPLVSIKYVMNFINEN